ncbi:MAG: hypothetical protein ACRDQ6_00410 [Pseudonocardiaceae bacterium]
MSTTGGTWMPHTPDWITPSGWEVADAHLLSYGMIRTTRQPWVVGVPAALSWVRGGRVGPVTERTEQPVTRDLADAERWAAEAARDPNDPPPLAAICEQLGVALAFPKPDTHPGYAVGVWRALRWVLGVPDQACPVAVPRRHPDGRLFTADDLYREATHGKMDRLSPEQRAQIRLRAEVDAIQYERYEEQITALEQAPSVS